MGTRGLGDKGRIRGEDDSTDRLPTGASTAAEAPNEARSRGLGIVWPDALASGTGVSNALASGSGARTVTEALNEPHSWGLEIEWPDALASGSEGVRVQDLGRSTYTYCTENSGSQDTEMLLSLEAPYHAAACGQVPPELGVRGPKRGMPDNLHVTQRPMARSRGDRASGDERRREVDSWRVLSGDYRSLRVE